VSTICRVKINITVVVFQDSYDMAKVPRQDRAGVNERSISIAIPTEAIRENFKVIHTANFATFLSENIRVKYLHIFLQTRRQRYHST
jgi:hypothetical protein